MPYNIIINSIFMSEMFQTQNRNDMLKKRMEEIEKEKRTSLEDSLEKLDYEIDGVNLKTLYYETIKKIDGCLNLYDSEFSTLPGVPNLQIIRTTIDQYTNHPDFQRIHRMKRYLNYIFYSSIDSAPLEAVISIIEEFFVQFYPLYQKNQIYQSPKPSKNSALFDL